MQLFTMRIIRLLFAYGILSTYGCKSDNGYEKQLAFINTTLINSLKECTVENEILYEKIMKNSQDARLREKALIYKPITDSIRVYTKQTIEYLDSIYRLTDSKDEYAFNNTQFENVFENLLSFQNLIKKTISKSDYLFRDKEFLFRYFLDSASNSRIAFPGDYFAIRSKEATKACLSSFRNMVKLTEKQVLKMCDWATDLHTDLYNVNTAIVGQTTTIARPNEEIEITAGIGSFNCAANPKISIDNKQIKIDGSCIASYKFKANGAAGKYTVPVTIQYINYDGLKDSFNVKVTYTVRN